ncbi:MAG: hypothetical protein ACNI27_07190 [Desulfovibrio sp.]
MNTTDLKALLKKVVEMVMPDLRKYYRVVRKAQVVRSYDSDGQYWADVQPILNDESIDENEPVIPRVEILSFGLVLRAGWCVRQWSGRIVI